MAMGAAILKSSLRLQEPRFLAVTPQGDPDRIGGFRQRIDGHIFKHIFRHFLSKCTYKAYIRFLEALDYQHPV